MEWARIAVMVGSQGRGSNMMALIDAGLAGVYAGRVELVISPIEESQAVSNARSRGVQVAVIPYKSDDYGFLVLDALKRSQIDLVCLAGYMKLLPTEVIAAYPYRVLNIHPALLPRFGGKGMYGMNVHQAVYDAGEPESGATVHYVTERYDEGAIVLQEKYSLVEGETPRSLSEAVLAIEHRIYPLAVQKVLGGI